MRISTLWAPAATSRMRDRSLLAAAGPICTPSINTIEPTGAPVTMISGGSGNGFGLRELNQLQAARQANVISTKTLTLDAHDLLRRHERITRRRWLACEIMFWSAVNPIPGVRDKLPCFSRAAT